MLSLSECRKILGDDSAQMTDEQLMGVRDALYRLCESVLDKQFAEKLKGQGTSP